MERSGNFYKAIRLGYILISILIGCMVKMFGQGNIRRWREKGLVEPVSKRPGKIEYRVSDLRILQQRKQDGFVEDDNIRSKRLCERLGMRREGCFKEFVTFVNNPDGSPKYEDTCVYAILEKEWNTIRQW
jgi:hypothetical protein